MSDFVNPFQDRSEIMRHAAIEAKDADITRLRAAINDALTAPFPDPELNSTWHQEPIGPNETPEEAIKRLVSVRAEWEVHKNNCENPVIAELRAALATARRDAMEEAAQIADSCAADWDKSTKRQYADVGEEIAAAIRAAAGEVK